MPSLDGTVGQVLATNGAGTADWQTPSGGGSTQVFNEVPTGLINSSNTVYTTASNFSTGTTRVYLNKLRQVLGTDYTETAANQITFTTAPSTGDSLIIDYQL